MSALDNLYHARPLPAGTKSIRVLDVHALSRSGRDEDTIRGDLRVIDLDERPVFDALSYVWGSYASSPNYITCNGYEVKVTANCYSALRHLRRRLGRFTIWIDAICIKQDEDSTEKEQQISLMGDIYSRAHTVFVWLGEGNPGTDRAMSYLGRAGYPAYYFKPDTTFMERRSLSWPQPAALMAYLARGSPISHPFPFGGPGCSYKLLFRPLFFWFRPFASTGFATFEDISDLLGREWVQRVWTYQEILLATNPVVVCGDSYLPWSRAEISLLFLHFCGIRGYVNLTRPWKHMILSRERMRSSSKSNPGPAKLARLQGYKENFLDQFRITLHFLNCAPPVLAFIIGLYTGVAVMTNCNAFATCDDFPRGLYVTSAACWIYIVLWWALSLLRCYDFCLDSCQCPEHQWKHRGSAEDDLTISLYTRRATNPKDMAFGLWAVLQQHVGSRTSTPRYTESLARIYSSFSVELLKATGSLYFLVLAAAQKSQGRTPSWVPDWSANNKHDWNVNELIGSGSQVGLLGFEGSVKERLARLSAPASFKFHRNTLTVKARIFADINSCIVFRGHNWPSTDIDTEVHAYNLWSMFKLRGLYGYGGSIETFYTLLRCYNVEQLEGSNSFGVERAHLKKWSGFINKNYLAGRRSNVWNDDCRSYFSDMWYALYPHAWTTTRRTEGVSNTDREIIRRTQMTISNAIAQSKRAICQVERYSPVSYNEIDHVMVCSQKVQLNDIVVELEGVPVHVVVRRCPGNPETVKLVSPAPSAIWDGSRKNNDWYPVADLHIC